jgi:hypothetical protein
MFNPGPLSRPEAARLNELERKVRALDNLSVTGGTIARGPDGIPVVQVARQQAAGFWAVLTDKAYTTGEFTAYSWVRVVDRDDPTPVTWVEEAGTKGGPEASPGEGVNAGPAYEVNNVDLPVHPDTFTDPGDPAEEAATPLVVWLWKSEEGDYYLFDQQPRWEFVRPTGEPDGDGFMTGKLVRYDQDTDAPIDTDDIYVIDLNGS